MKRILFILLFMFSLAGYSQTVVNKKNLDTKKKLCTILSENICEDLDYHIAEVSDVKKFDFISLKQNYLEPSIFTDMKHKNRNISYFEEIEKYEQLHQVSLYQPVVIGFKEKDEEIWTPYWYFIFYDTGGNILRLFPYVP